MTKLDIKDIEKIEALNKNTPDESLASKLPSIFFSTFLPALATDTLEELKKQISTVSEKEYIKTISKIQNNLGALHYAILNKDVRVFNFIADTITHHSIDMSGSFLALKRIAMKKPIVINIMEGDTPQNLAIALADMQKIKACITKGYGDINPGLITPNFLRSQKSSKIQGDMLSLCIFLMCNHPDKTKSPQELINFYSDLCFSSKSFDEYLNLKPYSDKNFKDNWEKVRYRLSGISDKGLDHYYPLVYYKPLYKNENFVKVFIPYLLKSLYSKIHEEDETCHAYVHSSLARKLKSKSNFIETIMENFTSSPFKNDKDINDLLNERFEVLAKNDWCHMADDKPLLFNYAQECLVRSEKGQISKAIKPKSSKSKKELILKI